MSLFGILNSIKFFLLILSFAIISSCSKQTAVTSDDNNFEKLPVLQYCDLRNDPDKYDGKIVCIKTGINGGQHGEYLSSWQCPADEPNPAYYDAAAVIYENKEDWNKIKQIRERRIENKNSRSQYTDPVYVTMIGLFKKNTSTGKDSSYERSAAFHFIVKSIESIEKDDE